MELVEMFSGFNLIFIFWLIGTVLYFTFYFKVRNIEKKYGLKMVTYSGSLNPNMEKLKAQLKKTKESKYRKELVVLLVLLYTSQFFIFIMPLVIFLIFSIIKDSP